MELSLNSQWSISSHRVISPQSNLSIKFSPQRSHLLLPVYSCNHHPQQKRRTQLFKHQAQDSINSRHPSRIYFPRREYIHKHRIVMIHAYTHHTISFYVENIIAWSISCIACDWPYLSGRIQLNGQLCQRRQIQSKETNPVKEDRFSQKRQFQLNPKGFSDAHPVKEDKSSQRRQTRFLKDFSDANLVKEDKVS